MRASAGVRGASSDPLVPAVELADCWPILVTPSAHSPAPPISIAILRDVRVTSNPLSRLSPAGPEKHDRPVRIRRS